MIKPAFNNLPRPQHTEKRDLPSRLDHYYRLVKSVLLSRQNPITGLLPASTAVNTHGNYTDAWVRDNVYSILAAWGLGLAYRKLDWDQGRTYELEQSVVKTMRGLLFAMMRQADKVEKFKQTQAPWDALHAKYDTRTGSTVVGDSEWGHLQIDATSLWLLMLGQMTASGLSILYTIDEVNFVQNLVYYIGRAYRTPDYGIWERGNKINRGDPELNASSVGMAKAALEALHGLDLFGVRGSQASVLHVLPDEIARSRITLESLLPRESSSKEVDAALLSIVGFPAFAVEDADLAGRTRSRVTRQLQGRYGCKRFLRDGHQTVIEDAGRLHYEPWEMKQFEHIECEWPLFTVYLLLDALFRGDAPAVRDYRERLEKTVVLRDGLELLPELYFVPADRIEAERQRPQSQEREPNANVPLVWAQSLYYLALMLDEGLLETGEIDPLGRRLRVGAVRDPVVQVALLAEDESLQSELETQGVATQTPQQIEPVQVRRAGELSAAYSQIGRNDALNLTGRPVRRLRTLTTSKIFQIRGQSMVFLPSFLDPQKFYLMLDRHFLVAQMQGELAYLQRHWRQKGRPTMTLLLTRTLLETGREALLELLQAMRGGECGGVHVRLGRIGELRSLAGLERIDFLHDFEFTLDPVKDAQPEQYRLAVDPKRCVPLSLAEQRRKGQETEASSLFDRLYRSRNLYEQVELLKVLSRLVGLEGRALPGDRGGVASEPVTVRDLLEDVYAQAARGDDGKPYWAVVRLAAGLCGKTDAAVSDSVTDILVRQKLVTVGQSYSDVSIISRPLPPGEIQEKIRLCSGNDVRDHVLTQEIVIYLGLLVRAEPELFHGLMTLRVGDLILQITSEMASEGHIPLEEAHERLMYLSPSEIQMRVHDMLGDSAAMDRNAEVPLPPGGWLRLREREGALNQVPPGFYPHVWSLLKHCRGIVIGKEDERENRLESGPILSEMTAEEHNFALWVDRLLNKIDPAKYRRLNIEALMALAAHAESNPALMVDGDLKMNALIEQAVRLAWQDCSGKASGFSEAEALAARENYYSLSPEVCGVYVVRALELLTWRS